MDQSQVLGALSCKPESFDAPWVIEQFILTRKAVEAAMLFLRQRY